MEDEKMKREDKIKREQLIELITKALQKMDDRKLHNIYHFVVHIQ